MIASDLKRNALLLFYFLMASIGIIRLFYWFNRKNKIVLAYHNIIPDVLYDNSPHLGVSHSEIVFNSHLKIIKKRLLNKNRARCVITFDDGYKNQIDIAAKCLDQHGVSGIFFISFQAMQTGQMLLIDKILMWVSYAPIGCYTILGHVMQLAEENRHAIFRRIFSILMNHYQFWNKIEAELEQAFSFAELAPNPLLFCLRFEPLDKNDIEELKRRGHAIGAHSYYHLPLKILPPDQQQQDFALSMQFAKEYGNTLTYSYPFGGVDEVSTQTVKFCKEAGFETAYMNIPDALNWPSDIRQYILPRSSLPNESNRYLIEAKLSGFEMCCKKLSLNFRRKRKVAYAQG